ncbi:MAG: chemotaxis protein CheW [Myxococcales bacterium]|nr:chemotaxis protein CheW [Myxococcales bacterium]
MTFDATRTRERVEAAQRAAQQRRAARAEAILDERAKRLALRQLQAPTPDIVAEVIVCRRGRSRWGFPAAGVEEVRSVAVVPLPNAPRGVVGLFQLRGRIHGIVDPYAWLGDAEPLARGDETPVLVLRLDGRALGVRIDEALGHRLVRRDELDEAHQRRDVSFVASVTTDFVELLDLEALFADERLCGTAGRAPTDRTMTGGGRTW